MILLTSHHKYFRYHPWDFTFYNTMDILDGLPAKGELTPEQENTLAGNPDQIPTLALHNMREAFVYAKRCCRGMLSDDEVYSSIYESLCAAARNFKPNRIRFFAYAKPYIRGGLSLVWKSKDVVKRSKHVALQLEQELTVLDCAEGADGITGMLHKKTGVPLPPPTEPDIESVQLREEYALIQPLMKSVLTDKEQTVIAFRYKSGMTFERIGKLLDTSRADIQLTHARALKKLRSGARSKLYTIK